MWKSELMFSFHRFGDLRFPCSHILSRTWYMEYCQRNTNTHVILYMSCLFWCRSKIESKFKRHMYRKEHLQKKEELWRRKIWHTTIETNIQMVPLLICVSRSVNAWIRLLACDWSVWVCWIQICCSSIEVRCDDIIYLGRIICESCMISEQRFDSDIYHLGVIHAMLGLHSGATIHWISALAN